MSDKEATTKPRLIVEELVAHAIVEEEVKWPMVDKVHQRITKNLLLRKRP